jgi:ATP-dependent DNA helicase Q4
VRNAYKLYYKLKTQALTQTISIDDTEDDFIDDEPQDNSCNSFNFNDISINNSLNISSAIGDLLDPQKPLNDIKINENVWNDKLLVKKKQEPEPIKKGESNLTKRFSLKMENVIIKPPRNPRKPFVKKISDSDTMSEQQKKIDEIPDLETILMEKSRNKLNIETEKQPKETIEIKNQVDSGWLTRNTSINTVEKSSLIPTQSSLSNTSSFGLSNLNLKNIESTSTSNLTVMNNEVEVKFHTNNDATDDEIVENSEEESEPIVRPSLHISKKRRLSVEVSKSNDKLDQVPIPNTSENLQKIVEDFDGDDSDKDPDFIDEETSPPILKRKRSLVKRSKDGITKVAKKLLNRSVKGKSIEEDIQHEKEEELNFLIDSDIQNITTAPRVSSKELKSTEEILDNYLRSDEIGNQPGKPIKVVDAKTAAKKEALAKKIATGTLNENYVRVNLKKKMFIRGKKVFNFSRYKKGVWKSKKAAALSGPEMDMRGCDGGVLTCHSCGGVGHFAQQCKQKGDNLLPLDAVGEEESTFPTLEEAAQMAGEKRLIVHASKPENIPSTSNEIWKESNDFEMTESDEEIFTELNDKENNDGNIDNPIIIGHKIPDDFLKKSGLLDMTVGSKDEIQPIYSLNDDGTIPKTPKEVFDALKLFGHKNFRNGQEQAVMRVLCGMSTLVTLSTGSGKSLCYQLPAYLYRKKGHCITLVVSPLVSLMEDQVHGIPGFINAQCLHTNQTPK